MWSLFVPVHVKTFTKSEIYSNMAQITSIVPRKSYRLIIYTNSYDNMHDSGDTADSKTNLTFNGHPRSKVIQFKDHEVN